MAFRVQRLIRTHMILSYSSKRFISSQVHERAIDNTPLTDASVVVPESTPGAPDVLKVGTKALKSTEQAAINPEPPLHPFLGTEYVAGGELQRSREHLDRTDEKLRPKWGDFGICLKLGSGRKNFVDLPNFWLRDNCRCANCVNQDTLQRAFDTFAISKSIMPARVTTEKEGLRVTWRDDGHVSTYPWDWILMQLPQTRNETKIPIQHWGADIASDPPLVPYDEVMASDAGVGKMLAKIREYGFAYVDGCPVSPEKTKELLERIAFIRVTHYGGFYDFTADLTMKDTAYTNLALPAHTDNTYFSDPAGLQAFHLLSHTEGTGGASLLVDGFHAASIVAKEDAKAYDRLSNFPIPWHASGNEGTTIVPFKKFPVFEFGDKKEGIKPELARVRWNNDDRGVVDLKGDLGMVAWKWYEAAAKWDEVLKRKNMEYWAQLKPGRPLIFDNWRVLHGRSAFTGKRRICGAYINHDDYISRWRNTNFSREEALSQIL